MNEPPSSGGKSAAPSRGRLTLLRLFRVFLALNLGIAFVVVVNAGRAGEIPESYWLAGPLWMATDEHFTSFHPCGGIPAMALLAGMASVVVWPRNVTALLAAASFGCWMIIGRWIAEIASC